MGIKRSLPLPGLFRHLIGLDPLKYFDKMGSNRVIVHSILSRNLDISVPGFEGDGLVVVGEVKFFEGKGKTVGVALGVVFVDLGEEDFDSTGGTVLGGLGLHGKGCLLYWRYW